MDGKKKNINQSKRRSWLVRSAPWADYHLFKDAREHVRLICQGRATKSAAMMFIFY